MKKITRLKERIISNNLNFIMEVHNDFFPNIVEEVGFKVWI